MCNCIDMTDAALAEHNSELGVVHIMSESSWSRSIAITTNVIEKRRGAKPVRIVAQFCPLCGVAYDERRTRAAAQKRRRTSQGGQSQEGAG